MEKRHNKLWHDLPVSISSDPMSVVLSKAFPQRLSGILENEEAGPQIATEFCQLPLCCLDVFSQRLRKYMEARHSFGFRFQLRSANYYAVLLCHTKSRHKGWSGWVNHEIGEARQLGAEDLASPHGQMRRIAFHSVWPVIRGLLFLALHSSFCFECKLAVRSFFFPRGNLPTAKLNAISRVLSRNDCLALKSLERVRGAGVKSHEFESFQGWLVAELMRWKRWCRPQIHQACLLIVAESLSQDRTGFGKFPAGQSYIFQHGPYQLIDRKYCINNARLFWKMI